MIENVHSLESEKAVLGSLLLDDDIAETVLSLVTAADFYDPRNAVIFDAARQIWNDGKPIELRLLVEHLKDRGKISDAGEHVYVASLPGHVISTYSAPDYAKKVAEKGALRRLMASMQALYQGAGAGVVDLSTVTAELSAAIKAATPGNSWDASTKTAYDAFCERDPIKWIIPGMIPRASITLIHAPGGTGKTLFITWMAVGAAMGVETVMPADEFPKCNITIVQLDTSERRQLDAIEAAFRGLGVHTPDRVKNYTVNVVSFPNPWPDMSKDGPGLSALKNAIRRHKTDLMVIDGLTGIRGNLDENSAEMAAVLLRLRTVSQELDVAFIVVHHAGKIDKESSRGSSTIIDMVDLEISFTRDDQVCYLKPGKQREVSLPESMAYSASLVYENKRIVNMDFKPLDQPKRKKAEAIMDPVTVANEIVKWKSREGFCPTKSKFERYLIEKFDLTRSNARSTIQAAIHSEKVWIEDGAKGAIFLHA
jgi:archaellum biogenesis ATPase FlaH